jgi:hypothetical protein
MGQWDMSHSFNIAATRRLRDAAAHLVRCTLQREEQLQAFDRHPHTLEARAWRTRETSEDCTPGLIFDLVSDKEHNTTVAPLYQAMTLALDDGADPDVTISFPCDWNSVRLTDTGGVFTILAEKCLLTVPLLEAGRRAGLDDGSLWQAAVFQLSAPHDPFDDALLVWLTGEVTWGRCPEAYFRKNTSRIRWMVTGHSDAPQALVFWKALCQHVPDWTLMLQGETDGLLPSGKFDAEIAYDVGRQAMSTDLWRDWLDTLEHQGVDLMTPILSDHQGYSHESYAFLKAVSHVNALEPFFERGMHPDVLTSSSMPLFHHALLQRDLQKAQLLLDYGANPNLKDAGGEGPLHSFFSHHFGGCHGDEEDSAAEAPSIPGDDFFRTLHSMGVDLMAVNGQGALAFEGQGDDARDHFLPLFIELSFGHLPQAPAAQPGRRL